MGLQNRKNDASRKDAKHVLGDVEEHARCHFDRREKSFLDPSHSLGMTAIGPSLCALGVLADKFIEVLSVEHSRRTWTFGPHWSNGKFGLKEGAENAFLQNCRDAKESRYGEPAAIRANRCRRIHEGGHRDQTGRGRPSAPHASQRGTVYSRP